MYNLERREEVISAFTKNVEAYVEENLSDLKLEEFMRNGNADLVSKGISKIKANIDLAVPDEVAIPKFSLYATPTGYADKEEIAYVSISIIQKLKSTKKFKFKYTAKPEGIVKNLVDFFTSVYIELLIDEMAESNLEAVNTLLNEITDEAGLSYGINVTTQMGNKDKITYIGDDAITFVADNDRVFNLEDLIVLHEVDDFVSEEQIAEARKSLADEIATAQTPEQLVQLHGSSLISYLCDINKKVKPMNLIKKVFNRNISKITGNKDCYGYYSEGNIYAVLARREGNLEVVLAPFDTETFRKVDVDVVSKVKGN